MRFPTLVVLLSLLLVSPAAADVTDVTFDPSTPSAATDARTVYRIGLTVNTALGGSDTVRIALGGDVGTGAWQSGTLRDVTRGVDVGSCAQPNAQLVSTCTLFSAQAVPAGDRLLVTLRGITNPATPGTRTVAASTSAEPQPVNSTPFAIVDDDAISTPTLALANPSAAAGAVTRYVVGFTVSSTGGLSGDANSRIRVTLPPGTGTDAWQSGTIRDVTRNLDVGSCARPVSNVSDCGFFSSGFVNPGDELRLVLRGLANSAAGTKTIQVSTTSDLTNVTSAPVQVVAGDAVTTPTVQIAAPSAAAGALTRYVLGFTVSATGGMSGEAGSSIAVTLPTGTGTDAWQSGTIRDVTRNADVGSCARPVGGVSSCGFFSAGFVDPGDRLEITLRGLTNAGIGSKTLSVRTSSDLPAVDSQPFQVLPGNAISKPSVRILSPSAAAGALTRYVVGFTVSGTGGLAAEAGSRIDVTLPLGTGTTAWQSGTIRDLTRNEDVGTCAIPIGGVSRCGFFSGRGVDPGDQLELTLRGLTNAAAGEKTVSVTTSSDVPAITSDPFTVTATTALRAVTVSYGSPATVRLDTTGGLSAEAGSQIRLTFGAGTTLSGNGSVRDVTRGVAVGTCSTPVGVVVSCGFFSNAFTNPGDVLEISFASIAGAGTLTATTSSDITPVQAGEGPVVEPTPTPTPTPSPTPTPTATAVPTPIATFVPTATPTPTPTPNAEPSKGTVKVKAPGSNAYVELDPGQGIPLGSTVDTKQGAVKIRDAAGGEAEFSQGIFKLSRAGAITVLTLTEPLAPCSKKAKAAKKKKAKSRKLWGDGKGAFRTQGKYSAATVRGTRWLVQDDCSGTLTKVTQGAVDVRDHVKGKTSIVRAGKSYRAKPRR